MSLFGDAAKELSEQLREIKGLSIDLKKSLDPSAGKPWDREAEFQRQNLRRHIMSTLFKYPDAAAIPGLEGTLWVHTSHTPIDRYRKIIADMENRVTKSSGSEQVNTPSRSKPRHKQGEDGPVALRKLLSRFRSFLSAEEKFWIEVVNRTIKTFDLEEAKPTVATLLLLSADPEDLVHSESLPSLLPQSKHVTKASSLGIISISAALRASKLLFVQKCLISLGDLARYREQYSESGGRPAAGRESHESGRRKNNKREPVSAKNAQRLRNYSRASEFYTQAKLLLPDEGNPSNQLAILSAYSGETFDAITHYYRALCVKQPFPTSRDNLLKSLHKVLDLLKNTSLEMHPDEGSLPALKRSILELHALWHLQIMSSKVQGLSKKVVATFSRLIGERGMAPDMISNVFIIAVAASWSIDTYTSVPGKRVVYTPDHQRTANSVITAHIVDLVRVLATVGKAQISEAVATASPDNRNAGPAQFITAAFRRALPATRLASQWLRIHAAQLSAAHNTKSTTSLSNTMDVFWPSWSTFIGAVSSNFGLENLPNFVVPLEEDIEMRGFIPFLDNELPSMGLQSTGLVQPSDSSKVHPNDEHLMRLRDIQRDALDVSKRTTKLNQLQFASTSIGDSISFPALIGNADEPEDDGRTVSTDDPVNLAMEATLDADEFEDDDQVVYPQTISNSPTLAQPLVVSTLSTLPPPLFSGSPRRPSNPGTTAEDLLSRVLGRSSPLLAPARIRSASDAAMPLGGSPLGGLNGSDTSSPTFLGQMNLSSLSFMQMGTPSVAYSPGKTVDSPTFVPSNASGFDRAVGRAPNSYQHQPSSPLNVSSLGRSARPVQQQSSHVGSPRMLNPLGPIGASLPAPPLGNAGFEAVRRFQDQLTGDSRAGSSMVRSREDFAPPSFVPQPSIQPTPPSMYGAPPHRPWS